MEEVTQFPMEGEGNQEYTVLMKEKLTGGEGCLGERRHHGVCCVPEMTGAGFYQSTMVGGEGGSR